MFCSQCGSFIEEGQQYCRKCGKFIGEVNLPTNSNVEENEFTFENNIDVSSNNTGIFNNQIGSGMVQNNMGVPNNQIGSGMIQNNMGVPNNQIGPGMVQNNMGMLNYQNMPYNAPRKRNTVLLAIVGVVAAVAMLLVVSVVFISVAGTYYFSDTAYAGEDETNSNVSTKTNGKFKTVIVTDNTYLDVELNGVEDAKKIIVKDSVDQKGTTPAETIAIENEIIKNYNITAVNLGEIDPEFSKEIQEVVKKVHEEFPVIGEKLTNLSITNAPVTEQYIAAFQCYWAFATSDESTSIPLVVKTQMVLNASYFLNLPRLNNSVKQGSETGHFPPNATRYSTVAHEYGHLLSFIAALKKYNLESFLYVDDINLTYSQVMEAADYYSNDKNAHDILQVAYNNCKQETGTTLEFDAWRATISKYAVAQNNEGVYKYDESIAESFHDIYLNGDNAKEASKYIIAELKRRLEG